MPAEIKLIDALNKKEDVDRNGQAAVFSIKYMKDDRDFKEIRWAKKVEPSGKLAKREKSLKHYYEDQVKTKKDPRHNANATRNVFDLDRSEIRKVKIRFIVRFNGLKVIY